MKKQQRKEMPGVLTAAEVRELTPRIAKMWAADVDPYARGKKDKLAETARFATTLAWAAAAAVQDEQSALDPLLDVLVNELAPRERWDLEDISETTGYLARKPAAARAKMLRLLGEEHHDLRTELVDFLDPERADEASVLEKLGATMPAFHAARARQKLARSKKRPWWDGRFSADPEEGLTQAQRKSGSRLLRRLVKLLAPDDDPQSVLGDKTEQAARKAKAVELIAKFPPRAALLAAEPLLTRNELETELAAKLWLDIARHPGAAAMFARVADVWAQGYFHQREDVFEAVDGKLPAAFLEEVAPLLLERLSRKPLETLRKASGPVNALTQMIGALWPASLDSKPIVDALMSWSDEEHYCHAGLYLYDPIKRGGAGRSWVRPLFEEALEHNFKGRFQPVDTPLQNLAETELSPEQRAALAWRMIERGQDDRARGWAVRQLSDAERLAHYDDPRVRPELFDSALSGAVFARARAELREGRLTAREAGQVAMTISGIWGGQAPYLVFKSRDRLPGDEKEPTIDEERAAAIAAHDPAMTGPLNDGEWAELRRLRGSLPVADSAQDLDLGCTYPRGPWHPEDRAQYEAICRHILETKDGGIAGYYAAIAATKSDAEHLPLLAELALIDDSESDLAGAAIERLRERMGLPIPSEDDDDEGTERGDDAKKDGSAEEW